MKAGIGTGDRRLQHRPTKSATKAYAAKITVHRNALPNALAAASTHAARDDKNSHAFTIVEMVICMRAAADDADGCFNAEKQNIPRAE